MAIMRTILWVLLLVALVLFAATNWTPVELRIWDGIVLETRLPALVIAAFLLGLAPMWLIHRARMWHLGRRIASLESSVRTTALEAAPPAATTTPTVPAPAPAPVSAPATPAGEPAAAPPGTPHPFGEPI